MTDISGPIQFWSVLSAFLGVAIFGLVVSFFTWLNEESLVMHRLRDLARRQRMTEQEKRMKDWVNYR